LRGGGLKGKRKIWRRHGNSGRPDLSRGGGGGGNKGMAVWAALSTVRGGGFQQTFFQLRIEEGGVVGEGDKGGSGRAN